VRGFLIGLFVLLFGVFSALSLRPGGLRNQLRNVARRFRLALALAGVYLLCSTVLRLAFPNSGAAEIGMVALAVALCVTFLVLGQDRQLDRR
jgi:uncharacterized membrane protein